MVIIMKPGTSQNEIRKLAAQFEADNLKVGITTGVDCTILGLVGDTSHLDLDKVMLNDYVERVMRVSEPYKKANRKFHPQDTVVDVNGIPVGDGNFAVVAGPCSVESEAQIVDVAKAVQNSGQLCSGAARLNPVPRRIPSREWGSRA